MYADIINVNQLDFRWRGNSGAHNLIPLPKKTRARQIDRPSESVGYHPRLFGSFANAQCLLPHAFFSIFRP